MSWYERRTNNAPDIDPFNAPDPIMPGGEPDLMELAESEPATRDVRDGIERIARRNERKEPGHHRHRPQREQRDKHASAPEKAAPANPIDTAHLEHAERAAAAAVDALNRMPGTPKRDRDHPAPRKDDDGYRAPEHQAARTRPPEPDAKPNKRSSRRVRIIVLVIFLIISGAIPVLFEGCSRAMDGLDALFEEETTDDGLTLEEHVDSTAYEPVETAFENLAYEETARLLKSAQNGEEPALGAVTDAFAEEFLAWTGYTPEEAGIDAGEVMRWALTRTSFTIDATYATATETAFGWTADCSCYYDLLAPDMLWVITELNAYMQGTLDAWDGHELAETDRDLIRGQLASLMEEVGVNDRYFSMEFSGETDADGGNAGLALVDDGIWLQDLCDTML